MNAQELLSELERLGVELEATGDGLRYRPRSAVSSELVVELKMHKRQVLALLLVEHDADSTADIVPPGGRDLFDDSDDLVSPPNACPVCHTLRLWQSIRGDWRCLTCDPPLRWQQFVRKSRVLK